MTPADLRAWRMRLGWTQAAAARQLDMTPQHYRKLEGGKSPIERRTILSCERLEHAPASRLAP